MRSTLLFLLLLTTTGLLAQNLPQLKLIPGASADDIVIVDSVNYYMKSDAQLVHVNAANHTVRTHNAFNSGWPSWDLYEIEKADSGKIWVVFKNGQTYKFDGSTWEYFTDLNQYTNNGNAVIKGYGGKIVVAFYNTSSYQIVNENKTISTFSGFSYQEAPYISGHYAYWHSSDSIVVTDLNTHNIVYQHASNNQIVNQTYFGADSHHNVYQLLSETNSSVMNWQLIKFTNGVGHDISSAIQPLSYNLFYNYTPSVNLFPSYDDSLRLVIRDSAWVLNNGVFTVDNALTTITRNATCVNSSGSSYIYYPGSFTNSSDGIVSFRIFPTYSFNGDRLLYVRYLPSGQLDTLSFPSYDQKTNGSLNSISVYANGNIALHGFGKTLLKGNTNGFSLIGSDSIYISAKYIRSDTVYFVGGTPYNWVLGYYTPGSGLEYWINNTYLLDLGSDFVVDKYKRGWLIGSSVAYMIDFNTHQTVDCINALGVTLTTASTVDRNGNFIGCDFSQQVLSIDQSLQPSYNWPLLPVNFYVNLLMFDHNNKLIAIGNNTSSSKNTSYIFQGGQWVEDSLISVSPSYTYSSFASSSDSRGVHLDIHNNLWWMGDSLRLMRYNWSTVDTFKLLQQYNQNTSQYWLSAIDSLGNKWIRKDIYMNDLIVFNEAGVQSLPNNSLLTGRLFYDANHDGVYNTSTDYPIPNKSVSIQGQGATYTDAQGQFSFMVQDGYMTVTPPAITGYHITTDSLLRHVYALHDTIPNLNFGYNPLQPFDSIDASLFVSPNRCNTNAVSSITVRNLGTTAQAVNIAYTLDTATVFGYSAPTGVTQTGHTLQWTTPVIAPFQSYTNNISFLVNTNNIPDTLSYSAIVSCPTAQCAAVHVDRELRCGFDPNEKTVDPLTDYRGGYLYYTINFQNTGNDTAYQIVVKDTLDMNLDPSSIEILSSSHPVHVYQSADMVMSFVFSNIMLVNSSTNEPLSHGYVSFKVRPCHAFGEGSAVANQAAIYFDHNAAIMTNTVHSYYGTPLAVNHYANPVGYDFSVYPVPTSSLVHIQLSMPVYRNAGLTITDLNGQVLKKLELHSGDNHTDIDCSDLAAGVYIVVIESDGLIGRKKIVVVK